MEKDFKIKLANAGSTPGSKILKLKPPKPAGGGVLKDFGTKMLNKAEKSFTPAIANTMMAGATGALLNKATGSRHAGKSFLKSMGNQEMSGGLTLNQSMGKGRSGASASDSIWARGRDKVLGGMGFRGAIDRNKDRNIMRINQHTGRMNDFAGAMNKRVDAIKAHRGSSDAMHGLGEQQQFNDAYQETFGDAPLGKINTASFKGFKEASLVAGGLAAAKTFLKSPAAKGMGKNIAKGLALGAGDTAAKKVLQPEATRSEVKTKPLGH